MHHIFSIASPRSLLAFGGLGSLWAMEQCRPFKASADRRLARWTRNLFLTLSNGLIVNFFLSGLIVAYVVWLRKNGVGLLNLTGCGPRTNVLLSFLFFDFITCLWHRAYHEVPVLWRLHQVHHSDLDLDVTSASRFHLLEILLSTVFRTAMMTLWGPSVEAVVIFEAGLLAFAQIQHSNLKLPGLWDARLRRLFVTPDMHRVHHSQVRTHTNSNYSTVFSFWDRWMRTYNVEGIDQVKLIIGLPEFPKREDVTLKKILLMPFFSAGAGAPPVEAPSKAAS
ncbi:MAG: sterol desaturase family protein [Elusimicrobia bacterium]|nr:sterol desaturase family protein [Elusimicrobiota bacterium]